MESGAVSFLDRCFLCVWLHHGQFSECLHSPDAARSKRRITFITLSSLQVFDPMVPEHSAGYVAVPTRQMRQLSGSDFAALFSRGVIDRSALCGMLAGGRRGITAARHCPLRVHLR